MTDKKRDDDKEQPPDVEAADEVGDTPQVPPPGEPGGGVIPNPGEGGGR